LDQTERISVPLSALRETTLLLAAPRNFPLSARDPRERPSASSISTLSKLGAISHHAPEPRRPVYKEEKNVPEFLRRIRPILAGITEDYEIIFSLDPSPDRTETLSSNTGPEIRGSSS